MIGWLVFSGMLAAFTIGVIAGYSVKRCPPPEIGRDEHGRFRKLQ